uniref:Uncharacterized protein n=1 Tax=Cacopsylla melanoneura TaxID=428564 RepID=A0A8D9B588_9HEMI
MLLSSSLPRRQPLMLLSQYTIRRSMDIPSSVSGVKKVRIILQLHNLVPRLRLNLITLLLSSLTFTTNKWDTGTHRLQHTQQHLLHNFLNSSISTDNWVILKVTWEWLADKCLKDGKVSLVLNPQHNRWQLLLRHSLA